MRRSTSIIFFLFILVVSGLPGPRFVAAQPTVYTDTMDSAETGLLSTDTFDPTISFVYQGGQFVVNVQQPSFQGDIISTLAIPEMPDSLLTIDALAGGVPANKYVIAVCRHNDAGGGYFFGYLPATGDIIIWRREASGDTNIAQMVDPALVAPANTVYRIGIQCQGSDITGIVNGMAVLTASDTTYTTGRPAIGVGANGQETDGLIVSFDNLTVTNLGPAVVQPVETAPAVTALATDIPIESAPVTTDVQTRQIRDPKVDPAGTLEDVFAISMYMPANVSNLSADTTVDLNTTQILPAGVQVADLYAEMNFAAPGVPPGTFYAVGFCFWYAPDGSCYDIYLSDDGTGNAQWIYGYTAAGGTYQTLQTGPLPAGSVDPDPGDDNFLSLTVYKGLAILSGSTYEVGAVIPLQGTPVAGDVKVELAFVQQPSAAVSSVPPLPMSVKFFSVWDISSGQAPDMQGAGETPVTPETVVTTAAPVPTSASVATVLPTVATLPTLAPTVAAASAPSIPPMQTSDPQSAIFDSVRTSTMANQPLIAATGGVLTQTTAGYAWSTPGLSVGDFYAIVSFTNPDDMSAPLDLGVGFRAPAGTESGLRFVIMPSGEWWFMVPNGQVFDSGTASNFDAAPGAVNTIEVLAQGGTGMIALNGVVLKQVDMSSAVAPGDVYVGTGFFEGDSVEGREAPFANFWVYPMRA